MPVNSESGREKGGGRREGEIRARGYSHVAYANILYSLTSQYHHNTWISQQYVLYSQPQRKRAK